MQRITAIIDNCSCPRLQLSACSNSAAFDSLDITQGTEVTLTFRAKALDSKTIGLVPTSFTTSSQYDAFIYAIYSAMDAEIKIYEGGTCINGCAAMSTHTDDSVLELRLDGFASLRSTAQDWNADAQAITLLITSNAHDLALAGFSWRKTRPSSICFR